MDGIVSLSLGHQAVRPHTQEIQPLWIEEEARKIAGTKFIVNSMIKAFAVRDGNRITGRQQFSGGAAAEIVVQTLGRRGQKRGPHPGPRFFPEGPNDTDPPRAAFA